MKTLKNERNLKIQKGKTACGKSGLKATHRWRRNRTWIHTRVIWASKLERTEKPDTTAVKGKNRATSRKSVKWPALSAEKT